ncbi:MAG: HAD hydrolase-like protein, partial [Muribaculaceae bacterium]|nr:HAD hydrolase-like protein [Muribaculaceae bacterium]
MKRLVIFDLDGTLLNTIADLGTATNHALKQMGFQEHAPGQYPFMVGNGITKLIERALPPEARNEDTITRAREIFLEYYGEHCMDLSTPYPGIPELLRELTAKGVKVAVASNKY